MVWLFESYKGKDVVPLDDLVSCKAHLENHVTSPGISVYRN